MKSFKTKSVGSIVATAFVLSACSTTSSGIANWSIDSAASRCAAAIVGGAILGALSGAASGGGKRVGQGAAIGAVAGGGVCIVILAMDSRDKRRLKQAQIAAAMTGKTQYLAYSGNDGLSRKITVRPGAAKKLPAKRKSKVNSGPAVIKQDTSKTSAEIEKKAQSTIAKADNRICRTIQSSVNIQTKGSVNVPSQKICRDENGSWGPA